MFSNNHNNNFYIILKYLFFGKCSNTEKLKGNVTQVFVRIKRYHLETEWKKKSELPSFKINGVVIKMFIYIYVFPFILKSRSLSLYRQKLSWVKSDCFSILYFMVKYQYATINLTCWVKPKAVPSMDSIVSHCKNFCHLQYIVRFPGCDISCF